MENIWIWIIIGLLLWQGITLLQFFVFLYYKFRLPQYHLLQRDDIEEEIWKIIAPYEKDLFEKGFVYKYALTFKSMVVGSELMIHKFYYYNKEQGVHAFLETMPYKGSLQSVKIAFDTIYESKKICTTENGMEHFSTAIPNEVYFFDHYLASWEEVYGRHLQDREVENETILKQAFTQEGWLDYLSYSEGIYLDAFVKAGTAKRTEEGYRYIPSLALWKFTKKSVQGYRKFSKILKEKSQKIESDTLSKNHHIEGLLTQMNQEEKARGESSNKKMWFAGSAIAFVLLFGLLGFSLSDIVILLIVLFVHELGHFLTMRYFGYTDTNIFFLPFGAVTIGHKEKRKAYEEFIVSLMGPLPGLLIGLGLILYELFYNHRFNGDSYLGMYAIMSLIINYINLLPIYPLDGGRILQTLLLLRYPKGQFYFYFAGLGILTVGMIWLRDPFLLIFVILVALGLKQSYKISELLQKLFIQHKQEEITKHTVASLLVEDEIFVKETLSSKSKIGKQAMLIIETIKPSRFLSIFGLGFYLLLLLPPLLFTSYGVKSLYQSDYMQLTKAQKKELDTFYSTTDMLKSLSSSVEQNLSMAKSMQRLDHYFAEHNISQPKPFEGKFSSAFPCEIPKELKVLYRWHNGVKYLLGNENLYGVEEMIKNYKENIEPYQHYNHWISLSTEYNRGANGYICEKKGIFLYDEENLVKVYYNLAHMLTVSADAFEQGVYFYNKDLDGFYIDDRKLNLIKEKYLSKKDQKRREMLYSYLEEKAKKYQNDTSPYLKRLIIWEMQSLGKKRFLPFLKMYLNDKDEEIIQLAKGAMESISKEDESFPIESVTVKVPFS